MLGAVLPWCWAASKPRLQSACLNLARGCQGARQARFTGSAQVREWLAGCGDNASGPGHRAVSAGGEQLKVWPKHKLLKLYLRSSGMWRGWIRLALPKRCVVLRLHWSGALWQGTVCLLRLGQRLKQRLCPTIHSLGYCGHGCLCPGCCCHHPIWSGMGLLMCEHAQADKPCKQAWGADLSSRKWAKP